jgi:hypothetical protein
MKQDSFIEGASSGVQKAIEDTKKNPLILSAFLVGAGFLCFSAGKTFADRVREKRDEPIHRDR